jgi:DNA (cytosine-5)-methyltransferase 1
VSLTFVDLFCGAGGSSIGLTAAGFELKLAANHWRTAIDTHAANFPHAEHLCADVSNYDMRKLPPADVLWASPICTEVSPAGGRPRRKRPTRGQLDLLEQGPVSQDGFERTRATFHDVIRATEVHRYKAVLVENVVEVVDRWELFGWWVQGMKLLGYNVQFVSVSSAHIGDDTNPYAPQWRDRLYMVFTRADVPLPDVEPRPLAPCVECDQDVYAIQSWKPKSRRNIGKYRQQYVYVCPNEACRNAVVEPYVLPAAAAIDWSDLGTRIGDRKKPLAQATMARIAAGLAMFCPPAGASTPAALVPAGGTWNTTPTSVDVPMRTRMANEKGFEALAVAPFLTILRNNQLAAPLDEPMSTITTSGRHHYLTVPPGAFYVKNYGGFADPRRMAKSLAEPLGAVTTSDHHALVVPYRKGMAKTTAEPLHTLATKESAALVQPAVDIEDCRYRMLKPREHLRGQRFPNSYVVLGNVGEQTMQAGNAVSSNVAQWLGQRVAVVLDGRRPDRDKPGVVAA